jgi:hypothetical protein
MIVVTVFDLAKRIAFASVKRVTAFKTVLLSRTAHTIALHHGGGNSSGTCFHQNQPSARPVSFTMLGAEIISETSVSTLGIRTSSSINHT